MTNFFSNSMRFLSKLFNNSGVIGLMGVIVGGLLTGYFSYKTQVLSLNAHEKEFKINYQIEKNRTLRNDIQNYIVDLTSVISKNRNDSVSRDSLLKNMNILSLKMALLEDFNIGNKTSRLTALVSDAIRKGNFNDSNFNSAITEWMIAVKSEMKANDYSVDSDALEKDLIQFLINASTEK